MGSIKQGDGVKNKGKILKLITERKIFSFNRQDS